MRQMERELEKPPLVEPPASTSSSRSPRRPDMLVEIDVIATMP